MLARKIAERLIAIGDDITTDTDTFTVNEIMEHWVTSSSLNQDPQLSWSTVGQLYQALSRLLTQSVYSGEELELNESWLTFSKLWKIVLQTVSGWIADNGGWVSRS